MADGLHPTMPLFDELEFLNFSEAQFNKEDNDIPSFRGSDERMADDFHVLEPLHSSSSEKCSKLLELRKAVASYTMDIYNSPGADGNSTMMTVCDDGCSNDSVCLHEQTLNALVNDGVKEHTFQSGHKSSDSISTDESSGVTSILPFSALSRTGMSPTAEAEVSLPLKPDTEKISLETMAQHKSKRCVLLRPRKVKAAFTQIQGTIRDSTVSSSQQQNKVQLGQVLEDRYFKSTKKMKRYKEGPSKNPQLERSRRNAINAKINRDRKKQEMVELQDQCERLQMENLELKNSNQLLEQRLKSAEEQLSFLRSVMMTRLGVPDLDKQVKTRGHSSAAGG